MEKEKTKASHSTQCLLSGNNSELSKGDAASRKVNTRKPCQSAFTSEEEQLMVEIEADAETRRRRNRLEEKQLMAEILRKAHLEARREKSRKETIRIAETRRRKLLMTGIEVTECGPVTTHQEQDPAAGEGTN